MEKSARQSRRELPIKVRLIQRADQLITLLCSTALTFMLLRVCVRLYHGTPLEWLKFAGVEYTTLIPMAGMILFMWKKRDMFKINDDEN